MQLLEQTCFTADVSEQEKVYKKKNSLVTAFQLEEFLVLCKLPYWNNLLGNKMKVNTEVQKTAVP